MNVKTGIDINNSLFCIKKIIVKPHIIWILKQFRYSYNRYLIELNTL